MDAAKFNALVLDFTNTTNWDVKTTLMNATILFVTTTSLAVGESLNAKLRTVCWTAKDMVHVKMSLLWWENTLSLTIGAMATTLMFAMV